MSGTTCYHCGDTCTTAIVFRENVFCCQGCKTVFEILSSHNLSDYYKIEGAPGKKADGFSGSEQFAFLDIDDIRNQFLLFNDEKITKASFFVPQIHCSSCIWVLENLNRLDEGFVQSTVNFPRKKVELTLRNDRLSLRKAVELLSHIGYEPDLNSGNQTRKINTDKTIYYKLGIAAFCFGNIMLLAFPEYLGIDESFENFRQFFGYISLVLSIPVFLYSGFDYLRSAVKSIRQRFINIDVPIALGIIALFVRSSYEIISGTGAGYFDSLAGLIFFLLLGKWFQQKTYDALSFDRNYKSYFPIAVNKVSGDQTIPVKIEELETGDVIELRNNELIPADGILSNDVAFIDYSFVTGESEAVRKIKGDQLYAGGKLVGNRIRVKLNRKVDNSYLTQLWNHEAFRKNEQTTDLNTISTRVSKYFTVIILLITLGTAIYWWKVDPSVMWNAITAVLIVACPCASALNVPFTLGSAIRVMGKKGLYLKNAGVIEKMAAITTIVFDKTGTITYKGAKKVGYAGEPLTLQEESAIKSAVNSSLHPLSISIKNFVQGTPESDPASFEEIPGKGIKAQVGNTWIQLGSADFVGLDVTSEPSQSSRVFVQIDGTVKGYYEFEQHYRNGLKQVINTLKKRFNIQLLTGDNDSQRSYLTNQLNLEEVRFNQLPADKLDHIQQLQHEGQRVMMVGDGLNDAGALQQSDVGIAVSDNIHQFSPACDAILNAGQFELLPYFMQLSVKSIHIIRFNYLVSFLYNVVGLYFAVTGQLSPIVAAILMPLSSITVVLFATFLTEYFSRRMAPRIEG